MTKEQWDKLTPDERAAALRQSDKSMQDPRWNPLVERMATSSFDSLTQLQRAAVDDL